jgi:hypothetical protein
VNVRFGSFSTPPPMLNDSNEPEADMMDLAQAPAMVENPA